MTGNQNSSDPSIDLSAGWAVKGIFFILAFAVLTYGKAFFVPILMAMLLALVFSPIRRALERKGIPAAIGAGLISTSFLIVVVGVMFIISNSLQNWLMEYKELIPRAIEKIEILTGKVKPVLEATEELEKFTKPETSVQEVVIKEASAASSVASLTPMIVGQSVLSFATMIFLLASGEMFYEKLVKVIPRFGDKERAVSVFRNIESQLSQYLLTITVINLATGICVGFAMWALGMPDPVLFGVLAFLLNYIPYLGGAFGVALSFLIGLLTFDSLGAAFLPAFIYWALTSIEGQFITPVLVGRRLKLNAVVVFVSVAFWAWLWSIMGMFLATPLLIVIKVFSDNLPNTGMLSVFLAERSDPKFSDGLIISRTLSADVEDSDAPPAP
jgi:predicted PurR-regulated permease PerM